MNTKKVNSKYKRLNPTCIKDNIESISYVYDTSLKVHRETNGFNIATKFKRNFK